MNAEPALKIFVVEDSLPIRQRITQMLRQAGGNVIVGEAVSAVAAISGILETAPDAVLLDMHLTAGTGLEVLKAVHGAAPGVIFIVLTNLTGQQYRSACLAEGARYFLDKSAEFHKVPAILAGLRSKSDLN